MPNFVSLGDKLYRYSGKEDVTVISNKAKAIKNNNTVKNKKGELSNLGLVEINPLSV